MAASRRSLQYNCLGKSEEHVTLATMLISAGAGSSKVHPPQNKAIQECANSKDRITAAVPAQVSTDHPNAPNRLNTNKNYVEALKNAAVA